jgi:ADP-ribose pyrophosphatase YjhB (NUDIX family)
VFATVNRKPRPECTNHVVLSVVLQVRGGELQVVLWRRAQQPCAGRWALPGGERQPGEPLERSIRRQLAAKVDVRDVAHLEQLDTRGGKQLATAYLGLVPSDADPGLPADTAWHPVDRLPATAFDHGEIVAAARERLQGKLSYTNVGFALAPATFAISELRDLYVAALGHDVSATNLQRVLVRRNVIQPTGGVRGSGPRGGRPAQLFRFRSRELAITDQFAVLKPPR